VLEITGAPEGIRTPAPQIRSLVAAIEIIGVRSRKTSFSPHEQRILLAKTEITAG
jgi:hypothetical protein